MRPRSVRTTQRRAGQGSLSLGRKHRPDYTLLTLCLVLLAIGLIVIYAIGPALSATGKVSSDYYAGKQLLAIALSAVAFGITSRVPLEHWRRWYKPLLIGAALATLFALAMPVNPAYPAHRWVRLGSLSFQSVELVKFAVLIAAAGFLAERMHKMELSDFTKTFKPLLIAVLIMGIFIAGPQAIHAQSDLGSMGVIIAMLTAMAYVAGLPMKRLLQVMAVLAVGAILVIVPSGYRRARLSTFLHPDTNCQTTGYQECQAIIGVGSGGMFGVGLGHSVQANGYVPEAANDSIFSIYAEIFGFLGGAILLGLFAGLFTRLTRVAERAPDDFSRLLVVGVLVWLSVQALINIGAMIGLLPLKGITLPFISYGGTSVVFVAAAMGLVFQVSRYTGFVSPGTNNEANRRTGYDSSRNGRRLRGAYHPDFGSR